MPKKAIKIAFLALIVLAAPVARAAQDHAAEPSRATGLVPLDARQIDEIMANWARITRIGLNPLGLERVNAVRAAKGKAALSETSASPVGTEVESLVTGRGAAVLAEGEASLMADDLPVSVDNSVLRFFPPIRNQGSIGSCVSFATTYYQLSFMTAFQRNLDIRDPADNTNKYSPKWTYDMVNDGQDNGSSFYQNYSILEQHGAATWAAFPYDADYRAWCLDGAAWRNALGVRTRDVQYVYEASSEAGLDEIKALLTDGYILVFGTYIDSWVFRSASDDPSTTDDDAAAGRPVGYWLNGADGPHAMTIVGYNDAVWTDINANGAIDDGETGAFRLANSWGTSWRESGFTWLAYDALRDPSAVTGGPSSGRIAAFQGDMAFVLTARNGYSPLMVGEFTMTHAKRNQLMTFLGRSATSTETPTTIWMPSMLHGQGGAYAFDGTTTAVAGTFVLDFTDILTAGAGLQRYYLGVSDSAVPDAATLSAFKIVDLTTDPDTETVSSLVPQTVDGGLVHAYVDYNYAGPAYNNPPQLSSPQLSPGTGRPADSFTYQVRYYDPDGDAPTVKNVVIDGTAQAMSLLSGPAANGWYSLDLTLAAGSHDYYFNFEDGHGESARAPLAGAADGPAVYNLLLNSLSPSSAMLGGSALTLTVNGTDFTSGAVVTWDGADRTTTYVSSTRLDAAIPASDLALGKAVPVVVRNASGSLSNVLTFNVNNPVPTLGSIIPASATGGGPALTVTLQGTNFAPNAKARWNGADRSTTYVGPAELQATLTDVDLSTPGPYAISVSNPAPAGAVSASRTFNVSGFTIAAPSPTANLVAGLSATFQIEVTPRFASFDAAVSFGCSGLPRGATATFSPATMTPGIALVATTLTVATKARTGKASAAAVAGPGRPVPPILPLALLGAVLLVLALPVRPGPRLEARRALPAAGLILLMLWLAGCSAGGGGSEDPGTPAGTYEITVRATSSNLTATTTVTLTVQ